MDLKAVRENIIVIHPERLVFSSRMADDMRDVVIISSGRVLLEAWPYFRVFYIIIGITPLKALIKSFQELCRL